MSSIRDIYYGMQNKTLKVGTRFHTDSFQCTAVARGKVTFIWMSSDANYNIEMLTDLDIPNIKRWNDYDLSMSGCKIFTEKDEITGREIESKVKFYAEFEYQSDNNFHVVQFKRVPEKSETTSGWVFEWYNEGMMYLTGEGFPKNRDKAIELFRRAADQDHPGAKNMLAKLDAGASSSSSPSAVELNNQGADAYEAEDYAKAVELFRKAADMGLAEAQNWLGLCYKYGVGVEKDIAKAAFWYEKAAAQGHDQALRELGLFYRLGIGGYKKDFAKAEELFTRAIAEGNEDAEDDLEELKKMRGQSTAVPAPVSAAQLKHELEQNLKELDEWFKLNPTESEAYAFQKKQLEDEMARNGA